MKLKLELIVEQEITEGDLALFEDSKGIKPTAEKIQATADETLSESKTVIANGLGCGADEITMYKITVEEEGD